MFYRSVNFSAECRAVCLQAVETRPVSPAESRVKAQIIIDIPRSRGHSPSRTRHGNRGVISAVQQSTSRTVDSYITIGGMFRFRTIRETQTKTVHRLPHQADIEAPSEVGSFIGATHIHIHLLIFITNTKLRINVLQRKARTDTERIGGFPGNVRIEVDHGHFSFVAVILTVPIFAVICCKTVRHRDGKTNPG